MTNGSDSGEYVFTSPLVKDFARFALSQPHRQGSDNALMRYVNLTVVRVSNNHVHGVSGTIDALT